MYRFTVRSTGIAAVVATALTIVLTATVSPAEARTGPSRAVQIDRFAQHWLGTRYRWGGTSRSGIDCSAYLRRMYRELFGVELPRTTKQQIDLGVGIDVRIDELGSTLQPGDLLFYVDRNGVPNHVVVYMGTNRITHSVSGRGVVIDPLRKVYGRRIVARRLLIPSRPGRSPPSRIDRHPLPAAGPIVVVDVPCPASFKARQREVRRFAHQPLGELRTLGDRAICDFRALASALRAKGGAQAIENARRLESHAIWLDSIDALKGAIGRGW